MALASVAEGTQVAVVGTEHTLHTNTTVHTFVLVTDTGAMVTSDIVELRIYTIARSGGTERLAYSVVYAHTQSAPMKYSIPVPSDISLRATLKQTAGTARSFPWKVLRLD